MENAFIPKFNDIIDFIKMNKENLNALEYGVSNLKKLSETDNCYSNKPAFKEILSMLEQGIKETHEDTRQDIIEAECGKAKAMVMSLFKSSLEELQSKLEYTNIEDFYIIDNDGYKLTLAGSFDRGYYHEVEVLFHDVQFILCPCNGMIVNRFRPASEEEISQLGTFMNGYEKSGPVTCMEGTFTKEKYFIVAQQVTYEFGKVYYYKPEKLNPGERVAKWVK
jgi:hypothetical protein